MRVLTVVELSLTVLILNAKTRLLSSKRKPDTLGLVIIRTSSLPTRGTIAVRRTTLTTEPQLPLARLTLGGSCLSLVAILIMVRSFFPTKYAYVPTRRRSYVPELFLYAVF